MLVQITYHNKYDNPEKERVFTVPVRNIEEAHWWAEGYFETFGITPENVEYKVLQD